MTTIPQVRQALADALAPVSAASSPSLRVAASWPGQLNPPQAVVRRTAGPQGRPSDWLTSFAVAVYVPVSDASAQDVLDQFVDPTGPTSITAAIKADPSLGGVVRSAIPLTPTEDVIVESGGVQYLGFTVPVDVRHT